MNSNVSHIQSSPQVIAAFDFDKTITRKDSFLDFLFFTFGRKKVATKLFLMTYILLLYKLRITSGGVAKQHIFSAFFKGMSYQDFEKYCEAYGKRIPCILSVEALQRIAWHRERGDTVVIVSASIVDWIIPWAKNEEIAQIIGTCVEVQNGILTGRFSTPNCSGEEKVRRFMELYLVRSEYTLYAYGDSLGDKPLLKLADYPFYKLFTK